MERGESLSFTELALTSLVNPSLKVVQWPEGRQLTKYSIYNLKDKIDWNLCFYCTGIVQQSSSILKPLSTSFSPGITLFIRICLFSFGKIDLRSVACFFLIHPIVESESSLRLPIPLKELTRISKRDDILTDLSLDHLLSTLLAWPYPLLEWKHYAKSFFLFLTLLAGSRDYLTFLCLWRKWLPCVDFLTIGLVPLVLKCTPFFFMSSRIVEVQIPFLSFNDHLGTF